MTSLEACLLLRRIQGIGNITARKLVDLCSTPEAVFEAAPPFMLKAEGVGMSHLEALKKWKTHLSTVQQEIDFIEKNNIRCIFYNSADYPKTLRFCPDAPLVLFFRGNMDFKNRKIVSIVGTRQNTSYGASFCKKFITELRPLNPIICSGFAMGIDIIAHRAALEAGLDTIACLGHGLDNLYPPEHKKYVSEIEQQGGLLTDFTQKEPFEKMNFPRRNRIIAGMAHATVVVESDFRGGSMNTANLAHQYGRELFAVPGRITDSKSRGCHQLILQQKAQLLTQTEHFLTEMGWKKETQKTTQKKLFPSLTKEEQQVYECLQKTEKESLDKLAIQLNFPVSRTAGILMFLEMKGVVQPLPGKYFEVL